MTCLTDPTWLPMQCLPDCIMMPYSWVQPVQHCPCCKLLLNCSLSAVGFRRRSVSAAQLGHLQEFAITSLAGSGTIFASHSPRAAPPNPAFALPSPTVYCSDGLTSHPVSVSASGTSDASFATPLTSPLPSPLMSPLRGGHGGAEGGVNPGVAGHRQGSIVKASSPPSKANSRHWLPYAQPCVHNVNMMRSSCCSLDLCSHSNTKCTTCMMPTQRPIQSLPALSPNSHQACCGFKLTAVQILQCC